MKVSEKELVERLKDRFSEEEIQDRIARATNASISVIPDAHSFEHLLKESKDSRKLQVKFMLSQSDFEKLTTFYNGEMNGTEMVRKLIEEVLDGV